MNEFVLRDIHAQLKRIADALDRAHPPKSRPTGHVPVLPVALKTDGPALGTMGF